MGILSALFFKIIAILLSVVIGFIAGRMNKVEKDSIASLIFYFIAPIVFFSIPASANLTFSDLGIVLVSFVISTLLSLISKYLYSNFFDKQSNNILAMAAGTGNVGYFMLPIASLLFDDYTLSIYMLGVVGINIYESSLGFYFCAKSISSTKESIMRVLKLPMLHAFILGCIFSLLGIILPSFLDEFVHNMKATYSILGMMMIGLGISKISKFEIDFKFTGFAFISKYIFAPIGAAIFIFLDKFIFGIYGIQEYNAMLLLSSAPIAANIIVVSSMVGFNSEKTASTVLISSLFSLIYIPLFSYMLIG